jgi:hypothetical protein
MGRLVGFVIFCAIGCCACGQTPQTDADVKAQYDQNTGKLSQLTVNAAKDGKPNITSHMDGSKFVRIEIDTDENGTIDRWEYYGPDQKLEKVGISRSNDGVVDSWLYEGPDGLPSKVEVSTRRDGRANRTEFYAKGELTRAEEDTDADGRVDKWETYAAGSLATVAFDMAKSGKPTVTIDYREPRR